MRELNCDVVIVGCGAAGLTAALAALQDGAKVIVLERSTVEDRGGNTRWTEALLRMPCGRSHSRTFGMPSTNVASTSGSVNGSAFTRAAMIRSQRPSPAQTPA